MVTIVLPAYCEKGAGTEAKPTLSGWYQRGAASLNFDTLSQFNHISSRKKQDLEFSTFLPILHRAPNWQNWVRDGFTFPRTMLPSAVDKGVRYLSAGSYIVELLTPCLLRCHVSRLVHLYWDFQVGEVVSCETLCVWWIVSSCIMCTGGGGGGPRWPSGSLFGSQLVSLEFFIDIKSFWSRYGPRVETASNRNEYQEHFVRVKTADA
jgi:hypothetical protein